MSFRALISANWKVFALIFLVTLSIYGQSLFGKFVFDDRNITENTELLSHKENLSEVFMHPFWNVESGLYRPTTSVSYLLNVTFLGQSPFGFHLVNIILYTLACYLIYLLLKKLFRQELLSITVAFLFLVLPIHTEVVANISGRGEILALLFSLLALYEVAKEKSNFWLIGLWTFLAIGSKEVAIAVIPLIFIVLHIKNEGLGKEVLRRNFLQLSAPVVAGCFYFFLRFFVLGPAHFLHVQTTQIENPLIFTGSWSRIFTALKVLSVYFYKTFIPINLCSDYSYNQIPVIHTFFNPEVLLGFFVLLVPVFLVIFYRKNKVILLSSCLFLFSFLPVSNLLFPTGTIAGERLFFFPSLGICLALGFVFCKIYEKFSKKIILSVALIILIVYALASWERQRVWLTEDTLFLSAARCAPESVLSRSNSGAIYLLNGELEKARVELEYARSIKPIYSKGLNNLGLTYFKLGEPEKAKPLYIQALEQEYPYAGTYENLVLWYLSQNNIAMAKHWLMFLYPNSEKQIDDVIKNYQVQKK